MLGSSRSLVVARLAITRLEARGIPAADKGGTSDPYVVITVGRDTFESPHVDKTLTPRWGTSFVTTDVRGRACVHECVGSCWRARAAAAAPRRGRRCTGLEVFARRGWAGYARTPTCVRACARACVCARRRRI
jgi:hypothetical protein